MHSEAELLTKLHAEQREMERRGVPFAIHMLEATVVLALIGNLQLALRHPENSASPPPSPAGQLMA